MEIRLKSLHIFRQLISIREWKYKMTTPRMWMTKPFGSSKITSTVSQGHSFRSLLLHPVLSCVAQAGLNYFDPPASTSEVVGSQVCAITLAVVYLP